MKATSAATPHLFKRSILCLGLMLFYGVSTEGTREGTIDKDREYIDWVKIESELQAFLSNEENVSLETYKCRSNEMSPAILNSQPSNKLCDCNDECMRYGGCCLDAAIQQWNDGLQIELPRYSCTPLSSLDILEGVVMTRGCPPQLKGSSMQFLCSQRVKREDYTYLLDIPVISQRTNVTYVNYFCALCNEDADELVNIDKLTFECTDITEVNTTSKSGTVDMLNIKDFISGAKYDIRKKRKWTGYLENSTQSDKGDPGQDEITCRIKNVEYEDQMKEASKLYEIKTCLYAPHNTNGLNYIQKIRRCPDNWPEEDDKKCKHYSMRVFDNDNNKVYTNPHCAQCNNVDLSSSSVSLERKIFRGQDLGPTYSFDLPIKPSMQITCGAAENIWDFIQEECTSLICGRYFVMSNGLCVHERETSLLAITFLVISEICLVLHIILYFVSKSNRSCHDHNLLCLCFALFVAELLYLTGLYANEIHGVCVTIAICLHYFWLASFSWMNILSFDIFRTFNARTGILFADKSRTLKIYNLYAWGLPLLIVFLAGILDLTEILPTVQPDYAKETGKRPRTICWITNFNGMVLYFLVPVGIIVIENCIFFVVTSYTIYQKSKQTRFLYLKSKSMKQKKLDTPSKSEPKMKNNVRLVLYIKLGLLQGTTWILMFIAIFVQDDVPWEIFTVVNCLQGAYIFVCFDLGKMCSALCWKNVSNQARDLVSSIISTKTSDVPESSQD